MRTLFTKILLWFLLTVVLTSSVTFYVSSMFVRSRQPEFGRFTFELREARARMGDRGQHWPESVPRPAERCHRSRCRTDRYQRPRPARPAATGRRRSTLLPVDEASRDCSRLFRGFASRADADSPRVRLSSDRKYYFVANFPVREPNQRAGPFRYRARPGGCSEFSWCFATYLRGNSRLRCARCRRPSSASAAAISRRA